MARDARRTTPQGPRLDALTVISRKRRHSPIPGGTTALIRALFRQNKTVVEGLFTATVAPVLPFNGNPGSGIAYGFLVTGITAPHSEFTELQEIMTRSVASFTINRNYVNQCLSRQAAAYAGIMKAGKTLRETSDMIMEGWKNRKKTHDIIAEKRSDGILGKERLYNPDTGEVYEFENGFYDSYDLNRQRYEMNNLVPLPDRDHDLWMKAPRDGPRNLR